MKVSTTLAAAALAAMLISSPAAAAPEGRAPAALQGLADGAVVQLAGTPHLWVAKGAALHWVGDTNALAGRAVRWDSRRSVSVDELRSASIGEPWLSAGLVKLGDAIYLVKWESGWGAPELRRVRSLEDAQLFGISEATYGRTVMDADTWEFLFGHPLESLKKGDLDPAVPMSPAAPTRTVVAPVRGHALSVAGVAVNGGRGAKEGSGWIVGEVRNGGNAPAPGYTITATLVDEAGVILATQRSEVPLALPPGASYPFALDVLKLPRGARAEVRVTSGISAQSGALQHVVLASERVHVREENHGAAAGEPISYVVRGNVRNASGGGVGVVRVFVAFVDRNGRIADVRPVTPLEARLTSTHLGPDEAAGFEVSSELASNNAWVGGIVEARVVAVAQPQASASRLGPH